MIRSQGTAFGPAKALFALTANMQSTADQPFTKLFTGNSYLITHVVARVKTGGVTVACAGGIYTKPSKGGTALVAAAQSWTNLTAAGKIVSATVAAVNNTDEQYTNPIEAGTAQAGASSTLTLAAGASAVDNFYNNFGVRLVSGAGSVQERPVTAYNGTTKVATVSPRWRTNLLTYSEQFDNVAWVSTGLRAFGSGSVANATAAPDGTMTADLLVETNTNITHEARQLTPVQSIGQTGVWSVYAKAKERTVFLMYMAGNAYNDTGVRFDLVAKTATVFQIPGEVLDYGIEELSNGWFRCWMADTADVADTGLLYVRFYNGATIYLGDGTSGMYFWGAQFEQGSAIGNYIATEATTIGLPGATTVYNIEQPSVPILSLTTGSTGACTAEIFIYGVTP